MKARYYLLLSCLALTACDEATQLETAGPVVVQFAQPFPVCSPNLPGFLPRDRNAYAMHPDSGKRLRLQAKALVVKDSWVDSYTGEWLDARGIPRRLGQSLGHDGVQYEVLEAQPAANAYRVHTENYDTLISLQGPLAPRLRYYRGWYYLSTPANSDSTKWTVRRLSVGTGYLTRQLFNPDSLRVRVLDPAIVQRQRVGGQLVFTLSPQSQRDIGQVSRYAGLWLDLPAAGTVTSRMVANR